MPYYQGDYYRGDPGFLSFFGGLAKRAVGFIPGVGPALQTGIEAVSKVKGLLGGGTKAAAGAASAAGGIAKAAGVSAVRTALKHPVLTGAGAAGAAAGAAALIHHHLAKGGARKHRRMRATNPKALRRALRRAYAFERIAMRTIKLVHPRKKGRFGGFKRPKKRVC